MTARAKASAILLGFCLLISWPVFAQTAVQDIFGRSLNQKWITLVDWDGYMANPLIKVYLLPPTNAALPGTASISASGERMYFGTPSTVSDFGPSTTISFSASNTPVPLYISIFPAHTDPDFAATLTIVFQDAKNIRQTNTLPIQVIDEDSHHTNDFVVTVDFSQDQTGFFTNATARDLVTEAANDWMYYVTNMHLDQVATGTESTYIWSNNFDGGYYVNNTFPYTGYLLYPYGTTNSALRSGGEGSYAGLDQMSNGVALTMKCSGGFEANIMGNYNTLGWLFNTNDADWLASGNLGNQTNDFFSIAHHEIGHALIFNPAHPGFATAFSNGAFTSPAVTNYYGGPVAIDSSDHLTGAIDPESGQGAFGYEYYGNIPRYRWTMTQLDLLCAQEVGYELRQTSAFAPFTFASNSIPNAIVGQPFQFTLTATGGIPNYDWQVISGALPTGLSLDPFSGIISGTPSNIVNAAFTVQVRDYHEGETGLTRNFTLSVTPPPPPSLGVSFANEPTNSAVSIELYGFAGETEILQVSTNLVTWLSLSTNILTTNSFQVMQPVIPGAPAQFYRAIALAQ